MTSATTEPPTLRSLPSLSSTAAAAARRSYSCYNCNYSFHISPTPSTSSSAASPSSFRCPCCHHRHLIPHHTISPPPPPPPPPLPPPSQSSTARNSDYAASDSINSNSSSGGGNRNIFFVYQSGDDESDSDVDYDSDNSLLSFTTPTFHSSTPALKSFVASLPVKKFSPNSALTLNSCSICMEDFEINPEIAVEINELPCEHYFHKDCIVEWLGRSNTCPLCRYKLPVDHQGTGTGTGAASAASNQWEVGYDAVLVVDLGQLREAAPPLRRVEIERGVEEEGIIDSNAASVGSDRPVPVVNGGGDVAGLDLDAMRDEDGDTLMVDA